MQSKNILITGSNCGIGKATLELCAKNGANIIAHCRKENDDFKELIKQISSKNNVKITPVYFDFENQDSIKKELGEILLTQNKIDGLVNNVGAIDGAGFLMTSMVNMKKFFEINLFSTMLITQMVLKNMIKHKSGSIVNVSSINATEAIPGPIAYNTSKAALSHFGVCLAAEIGKLNIRVNNVAPSNIKTKLNLKIADKLELFQKQHTSLGRFGQSNEVAQAICFLLSDKASFITGETLQISGGFKRWID